MQESQSFIVNLSIMTFSGILIEYLQRIISLSGVHFPPPFSLAKTLSEKYLISMSSEFLWGYYFKNSRVRMNNRPSLFPYRWCHLKPRRNLYEFLFLLKPARLRHLIFSFAYRLW